MEILKQIEQNAADVERLAAREHRLHRLMAASAFVFALCLLPVAQYFLVTGHMSEKERIALEKEMQNDGNTRNQTTREFANQQDESGQVAGVSTDASGNITLENEGLMTVGSTSGSTSGVSLPVYNNREECLNGTQTQLADLNQMAINKRQSIYDKYRNHIAPYDSYDYYVNMSDQLENAVANERIRLETQCDSLQ